LLLAIVTAAAWAFFVVPTASADILLCDYLGYDYTAPLPRNLNPPDFYVGLGDIDNVNPEAVITDPSTYQYTFVLISGTCTGADTLAGVYGRYYYSAGDGTFHIYEDLIAGGTPRAFGVNPPNPTAPSTFQDGTLILGAQFVNLTIIVNLNTWRASLNGTLDFYCGEDWGDLPCYEGWTFAGETVEAGIPEGYIWAIDGKVYVQETGIENTNWGDVKKLFR
jgi:hypothetical protein